MAHGLRPFVNGSLVVLPCLNPSGLAQGTRANALGQDINRQFHAGNTAATAAVRRYVEPEKACGLIDLHTDPTAAGFCVFEILRDAKSLTPNVFDALNHAGFPLEQHPFFGGIQWSPGLIAPTEAQMAKFGRRAPGASLSQWAWQIGIPPCYVFETPATAGVTLSVEMHLTALRALLSALDDSLLERAVENDSV
jgi:hypothetical protein